MTLADWIIGLLALISLYIASTTRMELLFYLEKKGYIKSKAEKKAEFVKNMIKEGGKKNKK